jgi:hypothetical protein
MHPKFIARSAPEKACEGSREATLGLSNLPVPTKKSAISTQPSAFSKPELPTYDAPQTRSIRFCECPEKACEGSSEAAFGLVQICPSRPKNQPSTLSRQHSVNLNCRPTMHPKFIARSSNLSALLNSRTASGCDPLLTSVTP